MSDIRRMDKIEREMPRYMKRNLKNMPNNKGYIYKGVWFFGHQDQEKKGARIMFEQVEKNILHIHKITNNYEIITEKNQQTGKTRLIEKRKRLKIFESMI